MVRPGPNLPSPLPVFYDLDYGAWRQSTILAACELGVFDRIAAGRSTVRDIAADVGANEGAMRRLLDTLVPLRYLTRKGDQYRLTPQAATYLIKSSDLFMDGVVALARGDVVRWSSLAEVVKAGRPPALRSTEEMTRFFATLVRAIFPVGFMGSRSAVAALDKKTRARIGTILDVAAGAAAWSIPFAQAASNGGGPPGGDQRRTRVYVQVRCCRPIRLSRG